MLDAAENADEVAGPRWDFFISRAPVDREWAIWVGWHLEEAGYRVLLEDWYLVPGMNRQAFFENGIVGSARTIAIVSSAYLRSGQGGTDWRAAWGADLAGTDRKLIPIRVADCRPPDPLGSVVFIDLFGLAAGAARVELVTQVRAALAGQNRPRTAPDYPTRRREPAADGSAVAAQPPPSPVRRVPRPSQPPPLPSARPPAPIARPDGQQGEPARPPEASQDRRRPRDRGRTPGLPMPGFSASARPVALGVAVLAGLGLEAGGIAWQSSGGGGLAGVALGVVAVGVASTAVIRCLLATRWRPTAGELARTVVLALLGAACGAEVATFVSADHSAGAVALQAGIAGMLVYALAWRQQECPPPGYSTAASEGDEPGRVT